MTYLHFLLMYSLWLVLIDQSHCQTYFNQIISLSFPDLQLAPYEVSVRYIAPCNCMSNTRKSKIDYKIGVTHFNKSYEEVVGYINVIQPFQVIKAVLVPSIWKNGSFKSLFNKTSQAPCSDVIFLPALSMTYRSGIDKNCLVKKGNYSINNIFPNKVAHSVFGNKFIQGRIQVRVNFFSRKGCSLCVEMMMDVVDIQSENNSTKSTK